METHRPQPETGRGKSPGRARSRRDAAPLDAHWLESEAIRYVARWESSERAVRDVLERKLRARCERTGEAVEPWLPAIPEVVASLVARGYVDDHRYALQQIERARRQGRSLRQIQAQLQARGVEPETVAAILRERDERRRSEADPGAPTPHDEELEAAWRTARKRRLGPYCADPSERAERRQRHLGVLARQGFSSEIAHRVIDADHPPGTGTVQTPEPRR